jgi:hypothetical protein
MFPLENEVRSAFSKYSTRELKNILNKTFLPKKKKTNQILATKGLFMGCD